MAWIHSWSGSLVSVYIDGVYSTFKHAVESYQDTLFGPDSADASARLQPEPVAGSPVDKGDGQREGQYMQKTAAKDLAPREGEILLGSLFSEPMRVETVRSTGPQTCVLGLVGVSSERFRSVIGDPARLSWHEVRKVEHYQLSVSALTPASSGGAHE